MLGIRNFFASLADEVVTASVSLVDIAGLVVPVAAGARMYGRIWLPFNVGASGGFKFQLTVPTSPSKYLASWLALDAASPGVLTSTVTSQTAFADAYAHASDTFATCEFYFVNGATAGNLSVQVACNSAAGAITVYEGATLDVVKY